MTIKFKMDSTSIIPMFDTEKWEHIEQDLDKRKLRSEIDLPFSEVKSLDNNFDYGKSAAAEGLHGNWLPQNSCGGHQWNAHLSKWQISSKVGSF